MQSNWLKSIAKTYVQLQEQPTMPRREDSATDQEHSEKLKKWAENEKSQAASQISSAENKVSAIDVAIPALKGAEVVTDTILSAGNVVPGGAAINAVVKGAKAGLGVYRGDYVSATANALDAALPGVSKFAPKALSAVKTVDNVVDTVRAPVSVGVSKLAKPVIEKGVNAVLPAATDLTKKAVTAGTTSLASNLSGRALNEPVKNVVSSSISVGGKNNTTMAEKPKTELEKAEDRYNKSRFNI